MYQRSSLGCATLLTVLITGAHDVRAWANGAEVDQPALTLIDGAGIPQRDVKDGFRFQLDPTINAPDPTNFGLAHVAWAKAYFANQDPDNQTNASTCDGADPTWRELYVAPLFNLEQRVEIPEGHYPNLTDQTTPTLLYWLDNTGYRLRNLDSGAEYPLGSAYKPHQQGTLFDPEQQLAGPDPGSTECHWNNRITVDKIGQPALRSRGQAQVLIHDLDNNPGQLTVRSPSGDIVLDDFVAGSLLPGVDHSDQGHPLQGFAVSMSVSDCSERYGIPRVSVINEMGQVACIVQAQRESEISPECAQVLYFGQPDEQDTTSYTWTILTNTKDVLEGQAIEEIGHSFGDLGFYDGIDSTYLRSLCLNKHGQVVCRLFLDDMNEAVGFWQVPTEQGEVQGQIIITTEQTIDSQPLSRAEDINYQGATSYAPYVAANGDIAFTAIVQGRLAIYEAIGVWRGDGQPNILVREGANLILQDGQSLAIEGVLDQRQANINHYRPFAMSDYGDIAVLARVTGTDLRSNDYLLIFDHQNNVAAYIREGDSSDTGGDGLVAHIWHNDAYIPVALAEESRAVFDCQYDKGEVCPDFQSDKRRLAFIGMDLLFPNAVSDPLGLGMATGSAGGDGRVRAFGAYDQPLANEAVPGRIFVFFASVAIRCLDDNGTARPCAEGIFALHLPPIEADPNDPVCGNGVVEDGEECDDGNSVPDDGCTNCQVDDVALPCPADFDGNGEIGLSDFALFLINYGGSNPLFDLSGDGAVNVADFAIFIIYYGKPCP